MRSRRKSTLPAAHAKGAWCVAPAALAALLGLGAGNAIAGEGPPPAAALDPVGASVKARGFGPRFAAVDPAAPASPSASPSGSTAGPSPCQDDAQCGGGTVCDNGRCAVRKRVTALFYFSRSGESGYRFVVPLYWSWWNREQGQRFLIPFFGTGREGDRTIGAAPLLLSGWSSNRKTGDYRAFVLAQSFFSREGDVSTGALIPLLSGWSSNRKTGDYRVFAIHSWWQREHGKTRQVIFPLLWRFADADSSTTLFAPLFVYGRDHDARHVTLAPFFHYESTRNGKNRLLILPIGGWAADEDQGVKQYLGFVPPLYHRRDRRRDVDLLFPIFLRWKDREDGSATTVLGPLVRHSDPDGSTNALLPLAWLFHDSRTHATTGLLFPLTIFHHSPRAQGAIVGPIYGYHASSSPGSSDGGWAGGVFPLLMLQDFGGRSFQFLMPLFVHRRDKVEGTDTTAVLLGFGRTSRDGWDGGLFPLLFMGRHGTARYGVIPGLYAYRGDEHGSTHVIGPIYASKTDQGYTAGLAPLFHFSRKGDSHLRWFLPPIYFHSDGTNAEGQRSSFTMIGPFLSSTVGADRTRTLFPLAWWWNRGPRRGVLVLPLAMRLHDDAKNTDHLWIGPFVRLHDGARGVTTNIAFPFFIKHTSPTYSVSVQFPFFWQVHEGAETDTVVFPLYGRIRKPGYALDVAFPLVWRFAGDNERTTVIGPIYSRWSRTSGAAGATGDSGDAGIAPLFGWGRRPGGKRYAWALPLLLWHDSDDTKESTRTVLANFYWERHAGDEAHRGWTSWLLPLYAGWRRGPVSRLLSPIFYHGENRDEGTSLTVAGPFYYGTTPGGSYGALLPLVFGSRHEDGRWSATVFPLFHAARKVDGVRFFTVLGGGSSSAKGNRGFVGPIYWRHELDGWSAALVPLFYASRDRTRDHTTALILPLFLRHSTPEGSITAVTPLIWHRTTIESSTTLGLPLFFDHHTFHESRSTGLLPFYVRHREEEGNATTHVLPPLLTYVRTSDTGNDFALFPLIWNFVNNGKSGDPLSRTTIVAPLFWHVQRGSSTTQVLFPLYVRAVRETADYFVFLNMYYKRGKGVAAGSYKVNVFPLFDWGRPSPGDFEWSILEGVISYSRVNNRRSLTLFFGALGPFAISSAIVSQAPTGTFFTSTPPTGNLF